MRGRAAGGGNVGSDLGDDVMSTPTARVSAETRKFIADMAMKGCRVQVAPDGTLTIEPPTAPEPIATTVDLVNWKRK